ncbi:hypothetical protein [Streptosporangium minutum]|uniref:Tyr recombinase domain-containing protein n=1 Tax=Streptosporangium minutum TaxID=569862 RepID=A0A243RS05_9ACTN|nr:hypothetical protein [Streptosporangium minutum]OUC97781.1 hypothetical protein CA984_09660 [Streptosporangium minutum]
METDDVRWSRGAVHSAADLGDMRFHDLRHTCVPLPLNLGVPPQVVRDIIGDNRIAPRLLPGQGRTTITQAVPVQSAFPWSYN